MALTADWRCDVASIGYPGPVVHGRPIAEPRNLGAGWVGFNFAAAFGKPVKVVNDALMQAVGSYEGGRMLFLGLGTGLGSIRIVRGLRGAARFPSAWSCGCASTTERDHRLGASP